MEIHRAVSVAAIIIGGTLIGGIGVILALARYPASCLLCPRCSGS